jgi:formate hydrogenlyase subunit 6/NADH:ubiquinone oxidoreductase subunit I
MPTSRTASTTPSVTPGRELVEGRSERSATSDRATAKMKRGLGGGLLKGLGVTFKHMLKPAVTQQYPHQRPDLPPRTRGVIALMDENCTVCMLCSRECPDWCIYIDSHKEQVAPEKEGGRARTRNVLDRFAIDFALCMYCGICIEVCPFDALFWSPEFEYSTYDIRQLTHEKERLREWMDTVPPPPPLEEGADQPAEVVAALEQAEKRAAERQEAAAPAPAAPAPAADAPAASAPVEAPAPKPAQPDVHVEDAGEIDQETYDALIAEGKSERIARAKAKAAYVRKRKQELASEGGDQ